MTERIYQHQINSVFSHTSKNFRGVLCCDNKPRFGYTESSSEGCTGGGVIIGGYRKVNNGVIRIASRAFTHQSLKELNGLYVRLIADSWMIHGFDLLGQPSVKLEEIVK